MCRGPKDNVPKRRCEKHSPEARAEARAADKQEEASCTCLSKLVGRYEELCQAKTKEASELVLSRWQQMISDIMREWNLAKLRRLEKREAAAKSRSEYYAEKVAEVKDAEKRARAEEAVKKTEAALLEFEAAEDALDDARHMEVRTRRMDGYMTPRDLAQFDYRVAQAETADSAYIRDKAWAVLKPIDDQPDPKTGTPTRRKLIYLAAERDWKASVKHEARMRDIVDNTPDHDVAVSDLAAAEARLEAAEQALKEAKAERHSSLSMGRPAAQASAEEVALAA